ncbi:class I SAM-dependent RNA methyltransferase [Lutimaribacter sp. EGI FJ00015]|uniref:Class I SAM-dependent RNA methyltransferase n=1 Tax=Lutimaribacter degradans TaxID=2945989 RepID=A0ACC5ZY75_9RHOB|nr:class I SAM-dependent RNA methyltransferase [Lutimaribacter sp. EGI FJ00013]MCM2562775.1 class I SAM-dependent RNA methyltransferase [Lutimaribacter sp. EGI FJ00013]MCO0613932.1 class I SAM-dependent RNA methyltransferase [Lutimaribacter sp. EGI FJ00015]MCO0636904.1 class I SAM-dependent RNA methyltransferase [Lutimaribacter sp. EGI FJ00014]
MSEFEIFLVAPPGLERVLADEARLAGFALPEAVEGGVVTRGGWPEIWRANLVLRGATRVLVRVGEFRAFHLAQLDKRARKFPWGDVLRVDVPVRVEVTSHRSKIYHERAAAERIGRAITEEFGARVASDAPVTLKVRIDDDMVVLSVDSSGESLHKRGHKQAMGKAPMRETLAALFLRQMGFDGTQTVVDPMCGSGTFVIEAAEMAAGLWPGRDREFAFRHLAGFDAGAFDAMKRTVRPAVPQARFYGVDRDAGAVRMARDNAGRAGVGDWAFFAEGAISDLTPPDGPPGIVIVNPPYGARIGDRKPLFGLYGALGEVLRTRFSGWHLGLVTSDGGLAKATGLALHTGPAVPHGGLRIRLYRARL